MQPLVSIHLLSILQAHTESKAHNCLNCVSLQGHCSVSMSKSSSGSMYRPIVVENATIDVQMRMKFKSGAEDARRV